MLKYIVQTCDWCGIEGKSQTMGVPEGWLMFDLRGGKDPGIVGYGWNVCSIECMTDAVQEWSAGNQPRPYGVPEPRPVEDPQDYVTPFDPAPAEDRGRVRRPEPKSEPKRPCGCGEKHRNGGVEDIARASADLARTRRYAQVDGQMVEVRPPRERFSRVPVEEQGHGGH